MKPLVLWCRWHDARLRLRGRDDDSLWGELAFPEENLPFRYDRTTHELLVGEGESARLIQLDEMGVEVDK